MQPVDAIHFVALAAQHAGRGRARQRANGAVHIDQQRHVSKRVQTGKRVRGRAVVLDQRLAGVSPTAVIEQPIFGVSEPATGG